MTDRETKTANFMSLLFILLYSLGFFTNLVKGNVLYTIIWGTLLFINLVLLLRRNLKKKRS
ncbi:Uncharacterised protein [Streptococcus ferus]|uniref:Uncharacterized protein n=1 Tax=Streptococcus ferus TaxID=1345 RepID=A0A2X3VG51_9STRE|nr:Uncharacterised protein [Streptococcus ferus]